MRRTLAVLLLSTLSLSSDLESQTPEYRLNADPLIGTWVVGRLVSDPLRPFATFIELQGGPQRILGEVFYLSLGPTLTVLETGTLDILGRHDGPIFPIPADPFLAGTMVYSQAFVFSPSSPNGLFRASNGASLVPLSGPAVVEDFDDPVAAGYLGSYDARVRGRLQAGPERIRTHRTVIATSIPYNLPLYGPLRPAGVRLQMVLRPEDLGGTGEEEVLTAVRWFPFSGTVQTDSFPRMTIDVGHSDVRPDYTIDIMGSQLPLYPNSGLNRVFDSNYADPLPAGRTRLYDGPYTLGPSSQRPSGYVDFPLATNFAWDGTRSLLLEFRLPPSNAQGLNGLAYALNVPTSPRPDARVYTGGSPSIPSPHLAPQALDGDNATPNFELEFRRARTTALSPFRAARVPQPDYQTPLVALATPPGTQVIIEYRGALDAQGNGASPWGTHPDAADGLPFLQFRVSFLTSPGATIPPSIDTLVVPIH